MAASLCDLPDLCLTRIFRYVGREGLDEMKLSCRRIDHLLSSQILLRRLYCVKAKMCRCFPIKIPSDKCLSDVHIEERRTRPPTRTNLIFSSNANVKVKKYIGSKISFAGDMRWSTGAADEFTHPCPVSKTFFEWMAKEYRNCTITKLHIDIPLDADSLRCWRRLIREYGIRAKHIEYYDHDQDSVDAVVEFLELFKPFSLTYLLKKGRIWKIWSPLMANYISTLKKFKGIKSSSVDIVSLPLQFFQFPPHFVVKGGVQVSLEAFVAAIEAWYNDELELENIEELILPLKFRSLETIAARFSFPYSSPRFGFAHIVIQKPRGDTLHIRHVTSSEAFPYSHRWHIYKSLSRRDVCGRWTDQHRDLLVWIFLVAVFVAMMLILVLQTNRDKAIDEPFPN